MPKRTFFHKVAVIGLEPLDRLSDIFLECRRIRGVGIQIYNVVVDLKGLSQSLPLIGILCAEALEFCKAGGEMRFVGASPLTLSTYEGIVHRKGLNFDSIKLAVASFAFEENREG